MRLTVVVGLVRQVINFAFGHVISIQFLNFLVKIYAEATPVATAEELSLVFTQIGNYKYLNF